MDRDICLAMLLSCRTGVYIEQVAASARLPKTVLELGE